MSVMSHIKSSLYKIYHSPLLVIHFLIPILGISLFIWYYSFSIWTETDKLSVYIQTISISFPIIIGLITSIMATSEKKSGHFHLLLSTPMSKYVPHLTNLFWIITFGFFSSFLTLIGFGIGFRQLGYTNYGLIFYAKTATLLCISVIPLYILHYLVSIVLDVGYSIGIGIIGSLLSALLLTGLGDGIWFFLPWGITARFSSSFFISESLDIDFFTLRGMIQSILYILISTLFLLLILIVTTNRWEGRQSEDK